MKLENIAKKFISKSDYLSLSTTDGKSPWVTPIYFASDDSYNLYFVSRKDTVHSKNIYKNKNVSFCIFNSQDRSFTAQGVQASGVCSEVGLKDVVNALVCLYRKKHPKIKDIKKMNIDIKSVTGLINNRVYKIVPKHIYVLDPKNPDMDTRVEVKLG